jgi:broad specificity phosphatase PhoE
MKWPKQLMAVRHGQSAYNALREAKDVDPVVQEFKAEYDRDHTSPRARELAESVRKQYSLKTSDYLTPLTAAGIQQARITGSAMNSEVAFKLPDVIYVSPYSRTRATLAGLIHGWPELAKVKTIVEDRIREQEHGLSLLYNDWRVFHVFHPEQKLYRNLMGQYWYQYPQGESVSDVRDRIRSFIGTLIREHAGERVLLVTHHLTILSLRAILERLSPEQFIHLDEVAKPVNCGVSIYDADASAGKQGKLRLSLYNRKFY